MGEIRKLSDGGNGSGQVTVPKDHLREMGLVGDDGEVTDGYLSFEMEDGSCRFEPVE